MLVLQCVWVLLLLLQCSMLLNHLAVGANAGLRRKKELYYKMQVQPQNGWLLLLVVETNNTPPQISIPNMCMQRQHTTT